jgi:hypothetical protein
MTRRPASVRLQLKGKVYSVRVDDGDLDAMGLTVQGEGSAADAEGERQLGMQHSQLEQVKGMRAYVHQLG